MTTKWMICPACHGEGHCINPNIDAGGLTREDFDEDPDFAQDYMSGIYDVSCAACQGTGKILRTHMTTLRRSAADRRLAAREDGDVEGYLNSGDFRYG